METWEQRTHYCGELRQCNEGQQVTVAGWVRKNRSLGNLVFLDVWDRTGIVQIAAEPALPEHLFTQVSHLKRESVIAVHGIVRCRPEGMKNPSLPTGDIEIVLQQFVLYSQSETPPFHLVDDCDAAEELRIRHRYLDLRRPVMMNNILLRHQVTRIARRFLEDHGFIEVETPFLTRSTPEGARDYLVPSRLQPGTFYALPQSPQLFKQLLMVGGLDRYYQIARCFRD